MSTAVPFSRFQQGAPVFDRPLLDGLRSEWRRLGQPGTWFSGAERVAIARLTRSSIGGTDTSTPALPTPVLEAVVLIATKPNCITNEVVDRLDASGLSRLAYIEIVGIVSRLVGVDTLLCGVGVDPEPLPKPLEGNPSGEVPVGVKQRSAWVPMVGGANPKTALSGVTAECEAQRELHGVLYLSYEEMSDLAITKQLTRCQLELVASRTSLLNHCVF